MNEIEAAKLQAYLWHWTRTRPSWHQQSAQQIAAELARDVDFSNIRVATWLQSPDGGTIIQIVQNALPYPYNYGADVLADAIEIAARQRTEKERLYTLGGGTAVAVLLVMWLRSL